MNPVDEVIVHRVKRPGVHSGTPTLRRHLTLPSITSYAISLLGITGSVPGTIGFPLSTGGPATVIWTWFIGSIFSICVAFSVAELVSAYPTAGGMYYVTAHVIPKEKLPLWAWIVGWANFLGQTAGATGLAWSVASMGVAWVKMLGKMDEQSAVRREVVVGVAIAVVVLMGIICSLTSKNLHRIIIWLAPINVFGTVAICVALFAEAPKRHGMKYALTAFTDESGYGSKPFSFLLSFTSVTYTLTDYDGTTHLSEETHKPGVYGPRAINIAIALSGFLGLILNTVVVLHSGNLQETVDSPLGNPVAHILHSNLPLALAMTLWTLVILLQFTTGICALLADTRLTYAFARDNAIPYASYWAQVSRWTHTPLRSVWLTVGCCILLLMLGIASEEGMVSIFNITSPALDVSYAAVIAARWWYRKDMQWTPGPWTMGKWGKPMNAVAVTWVAFTSVLLMLPVRWPVRWGNLNYAPFVAVGLAAFAVGWWYLGARRVYTGPRLIQPTPPDSAGPETIERETDNRGNLVCASGSDHRHVNRDL